MAQVLKFRWNTTDLDLQAGGSGLQLASWRPAVATPIGDEPPGPVTERMRIWVHGSSHDNLASHLQNLHAMQKHAAEYMADRTHEEPVWLHTQLTNETGATRALVRSIDIKFETGWYDPTSVANKAYLTLVVVREPFWERTSNVSLPEETLSTTVSAFYDYTASPGADIVGDESARIHKMDIYSPAAGANIGRVWIGIRSANKHGTNVTNFQRVWELEDTGATLGTDASRASDSTASPGSGTTKVTITPGTATWAKRLTIEAGDVISTLNLVNNLGTFVWLLRCKVSAGTWEIKLFWGYEAMADADFIEGPTRELTSTSWDYLEMGEQTIPLRDIQIHTLGVGEYSTTYESSYAIQIWARRTDGSGTLDLDCLCPVPCDEGYLRITGFDLDSTSSENICFAESPTGKRQVVAVSGSGFEQIVNDFEANNFRLPPGDGRIVIVCAGPTSSLLADYVEMCTGDNGKHYPSWLSLRGSE